MSDWAKKFEIMKHYDASANSYDLQYGEEQRMKIRFILEKVDLKENLSVLDVGCGTGILFEYLLEKIGVLVGVDISKETLRKAKEKIKGKFNVFLIQADADYLPFIRETFDAIFAVTLLQNTPSPRTTLTELTRVAKPSATLIVTGLKKRFSLDDFRKLLQGFNLKDLWNTSELKDYIAYLSVCF